MVLVKPSPLHHWKRKDNSSQESNRKKLAAYLDLPWSQLTLSFPRSKSNILPVRIGTIIIFHLSKVWKAKFFMLCMQNFWWGCRGNLNLGTLGSERVKPLSFLLTLLGDMTFRRWWNDPDGCVSKVFQLTLASPLRHSLALLSSQKCSSQFHRDPQTHQPPWQWWLSLL